MDSSILEAIVVAVISSSIVSSILLFFIKTYLKSFIDYEFNKREKMINLSIERFKHFSEEVTKEQIGLYPEIVELVYRISAILRDGIEKEQITDWDFSLRPLSAQLTEILFKYRFFLSFELFDKLHKFKHHAQDASMLIDYLTRDDIVFKQSIYQQEIIKMKEIVKKTNMLENEINTIIKPFEYKLKL